MPGSCKTGAKMLYFQDPKIVLHRRCAALRFSGSLGIFIGSVYTGLGRILGAICVPNPFPVQLLEGLVGLEPTCDGD